jgi:Ca2+-binding EF-hand superfamily protein
VATASVQAADASVAVVAESFLYSPQMAKVFAQFDTNSDGSLDVTELRQLLLAIGLDDGDAASALPRFDTDKDGARDCDVSRRWQALP